MHLKKTSVWCLISSGNFYSLSKRMTPLHRRLPQGKNTSKGLLRIYFIIIFHCVCVCMCSQSESLFFLLATGVRSSSWSTCRCETFPATGRGSSPSTAAFSPTSPQGRTATAKLCTDRAGRSYEQGNRLVQGSWWEHSLWNMNVIKAQAPKTVLSAQEVHLKCTKHNDSHSVLFLLPHSSPRNTSAAFTTGMVVNRIISQLLLAERWKEPKHPSLSKKLSSASYSNTISSCAD